MSTESNEKDNRPRVFPALEMNMKINADSDAGK
jgi:hypothetical protein